MGVKVLRPTSADSVIRLKRLGIEPALARQLSKELEDSDINGTEIGSALLDYFCHDPVFQEDCMERSAQFRLEFNKPIQNTIAAYRETVEQFQVLLRGDRFSLNKHNRRNDRFYAITSAALWAYLYDPDIRAKVDSHYYHFMLGRDLEYIRKQAKKRQAA